MTRHRAHALFAISVAVLLIVAVQLAGANDEPSADLVGSAVTTTTPTTSATSSTTASTAVTSPTTTTAPDLPGLPERLQIPDLGVDSPVVSVGLESDGTMQIPGVTEAGWYWPGARPGTDVGSPVIAAHVDYGGRRGVFFDLRSIEVGTEVSVVDDEGTSHRYRVIERFQVAKGALPVDELFRIEGSETLTLITCGGTFDAGARSYADNIVVRAVPI